MIISILLLSIYFLLLSSSLYGFLFLNTSSSYSKTKEVINNDRLMSIVVPFRNESLRISSLLDSFDHQQDVSIINEIIFVDDHSEDKSCEIIANWIQSSNLDCKLFQLESDYGKKQAINLGVNSATGKYILSFDSDISFDSLFFNKLNDKILFDKGLYIFSVIENSGILLSQLESNILSVINSGMANLKCPVLANGACLLYEKNTFLKINPFLNNYNISSGDDLFILQSFKNNNVSFSTISPFENLVKTVGPETFKEYFSRSFRWSSKMPNLSLSFTKFFGSVVLLVNFLTIAISIMIFISFSKWMVIFLLSKFFIDLLLSLISAYYFKNTKLFLFSFPMFILYPICILINTFLILFNYPIYWKGRRVVN